MGTLYSPDCWGTGRGSQKAVFIMTVSWLSSDFILKKKKNQNREYQHVPLVTVSELKAVMFLLKTCLWKENGVSFVKKYCFKALTSELNVSVVLKLEHFDPRSMGKWDVETVHLIQSFQSYGKSVGKIRLKKNIFKQNTSIPARCCKERNLE